MNRQRWSYTNVSFSLWCFVSLTLGFGFSIAEAQRQKTEKIRRDDPIMIPATEDSYVTWSDVTEMKLAIYGIGGVFVLWAGSQIFSVWLKKQDRTAETLEKLVDTVNRIEGRLEHTPTREEVLRQIVEYMSMRDPRA